MTGITRMKQRDREGEAADKKRGLEVRHGDDDDGWLRDPTLKILPLFARHHRPARAEGEVSDAQTTALYALSTLAQTFSSGRRRNTTLKSISGLVPPVRGTVSFRGRRIDGLASEKIVRLGISHVPEGRELFPELTVLENLRMGAYVRTDPPAIQRTLERVHACFPLLAERRTQLASGALRRYAYRWFGIGVEPMIPRRLGH